MTRKKIKKYTITHRNTKLKHKTNKTKTQKNESPQNKTTTHNLLCVGQLLLGFEPALVCGWHTWDVPLDKTYYPLASVYQWQIASDWRWAPVRTSLLSFGPQSCLKSMQMLCNPLRVHMYISSTVSRRDFFSWSYSSS